MKIQKMVNVNNRVVGTSKIIVKLSFIVAASLAIMSLVDYLLLFKYTDVVWHTLFESISIMFSIVIFLSTFYAFTHTKRIRTIVLSMIFLAVSIYDICYVFSFLGLGGEGELNNYISQTFYFIGRIVKSIGLLIFSLIKIGGVARSKRYLFLISTVVFVMVTLIGMFYLFNINPTSSYNFFKSFYYNDSNPKLLIDVLTARWFIIICYSAAGIILLKEYLLTQESYVKFMVVSIMFSIISHLAFLFVTGNENSFNFLAYLFRMGAAYLLFQAIFISYVKKPYEELASAKVKIEEDAKKLEEIIDDRTQKIKKINQILLKDLEIAKSIQKAMLPPKHFCYNRAEFCVEYKPCQALGGDFCGVFEIDKDNIGIYIGDVSGHGVPAAMLTMFLNQTIISVAQKEGQKFGKKVERPEQVLKLLYNAFNDSSFEDDMYIVLFYAVYNLPTGILNYSSAGMNTIPIKINSRGELEYLRIEGFPICKLANLISSEFKQKSISLKTGDKVLLYTDGVADLEDGNASRYGKERLAKIAKSSLEKQVNEINKLILDDLSNFSRGKDFEDDVTIVIFEIK